MDSSWHLVARLGSRLVRGLLLLTGCAVAGAGSWWLAQAPLATVATALNTDGLGGLGRLPAQALISAILGAALVAATGWLVLVTLAVLAGRLVGKLAPRSPRAVWWACAAERAAPAPVRRMVGAVLSAATVAGAAPLIATPALAAPVLTAPVLADSGVAGPAAAGPTLAGPVLAGPVLTDPVLAGPVLTDPSGRAAAQPRPADLGWAARQRSLLRALDGLPLPDRTTGRPPPRVGRERAADPRRRVLVRPGDSLWSIAAELLPPETHGTGAVASGWHRLYAANRGRIGSDPDQILPGTRLAVPPDLTTPLPPGHSPPAADPQSDHTQSDHTQSGHTHSTHTHRTDREDQP